MALDVPTAAIAQDAPFDAAGGRVIEWELEPGEVAAAEEDPPSDAEVIESSPAEEAAAAEEGSVDYTFVADPAFGRGVSSGRPGYWIAADVAEAEAAAAVAAAAEAVANAAALAAAAEGHDAASNAEGHEDPVDAAAGPAAWSSLLPGFGADEEPDEPGCEPEPTALPTKKEEASDEDPEREPPASRALDWLGAKKEEPRDEACQNEPL